MPANCCVPYCDAGHVKNGNMVRRAMFKVPRDDHKRKIWESMIPRKDPLNPSDKVCSVHFEENDIRKANKFIIEGKEVFLPMLNWRLKENAVPRIFLGCPNNLKKTPRQRKPPKVRTKAAEKPTKLSQDFMIQQVSATQATKMNGFNSNLNIVYDNTTSSLLPFQFPSLTSTYFNKRKISGEEGHFVVVHEELPSEPVSNSSKSIDVSDADQEEVILNYLSVEMNPSKDHPSSTILINTSTKIVGSACQQSLGEEKAISSHLIKLNSNQNRGRLQNIHINIGEVRLPSLAWAWIEIEKPNCPSKTNMICAENVYIAGKIHIRRSVEIDLLAGVACYSLFGAFVGIDSLNTTFSSESDLSELLRCYGEAKLCPGLSVSTFIGQKIPSSLGYQDGEMLRSSTCTGIEPNSNPCKNCILLFKNQEKKS